MTKHVRIENADTSDYSVTCQVWETGLNGEQDYMVSEHILGYPTSLAELTIWKNRYIIIKEEQK